MRELVVNPNARRNRDAKCADYLAGVQSVLYDKAAKVRRKNILSIEIRHRDEHFFSRFITTLRLFVIYVVGR